MAKFVGGLPPFVGTRDNLTIYFMKGEYIVRTKSSLTGKRVKRDPAFARTMENAGRLKKAAGIASLVYRQMPVDARVYKQYRELVGKAMGLLKDGFDVDHVVIVLEALYLSDHLHQEERKNMECPAQNKTYEQRLVRKPGCVTLYKTFVQGYYCNRGRNMDGRRFRLKDIYNASLSGASLS
ncbi:hypothetical protein [Chitinophaga sp. S165]|uniref:hypothetical protein n=1 Tax=Chitinophaga sp. S165 TaxID=2135462 RepID=UPI000D71CD37|nr:hypothetical protein [Chitinophaga sp. S165]PWV56672.1 hypothetical protein C7475_1011189 [Chitinophaga sp. S165]